MSIMNNFGFVRVAAATPNVKVADCDYNTDEAIKLIDEAENEHISVIVFPELSITAYTCADLFQQQVLLSAVEQSVIKINKALNGKNTTAIIGVPLPIDNRLYNTAAVLHGGKICGFVPKLHIPNYGEFYEKRWFASSEELRANKIKYAGQEVPIGTNLLFELPNLKFGVELCEDLWAAIPPSSLLALHGAEIIFNLSASNEIAGKHIYRKSLVKQQSARCLSGYVYASAGAGESTTDTVFSGCSMIAENGNLLAEEERFKTESSLIVADIDVEMLRNSRRKNMSFSSSKLNFSLNQDFKTIEIEAKVPSLGTLKRVIVQTPFVPADDATLNERCNEIFSIQVAGLAKRLSYINAQASVIGVSGGLDSTLALLVMVRAFDQLKLPRKNIYGITMPGFGTTNRTYSNAIELMKALGITTKEISITDAVNQHFKDIEHDPSVHDITFENSQARERTQILMDYANKVNGLVIGTGDLSELALGWCTYNGDHMSMYGVNTGVPKTLVRTLTKWISDNVMDEKSKAILNDVIDTPISPELLPADENGEITQITEDVVGPYILHDFFLYQALHSGFGPAKIYYLAQHAFAKDFEKEIILKWLRTFYWRFFSQQFKRSCMPDGPKIGSVNLSPRGDWRMPSDASVALWMKEIENIK